MTDQNSSKKNKSRKRAAALYGKERYTDVAPHRLAAESFIPGWRCEYSVRNLAERHDPAAVRRRAA